MQQKRWTSEKGSAMVEFAILTGVLLPIGLGMAMIGKLSDLRQTNEQASRYATWEPTVYSRRHLSALDEAVVDTRFFGSDSVLLNSSNSDNGAEANDPGANDSSEAATENILWGSASRETGGMRELASVSRDESHSVSPNYEFDTGEAEVAHATGSAVAILGSVFDELSGNSWGIVADGLLHAQTEVMVEPTSFIRAAGGGCSAASGNNGSSQNDGANQKVCLSSAGAILADGWSASGDEEVESRVRSLVPSSAAAVLGDALSELSIVPLFEELEGLEGAFGHVDVDVLPEYAQP